MVAAVLALAAVAAASEPPHLRRAGTATQLVVDGAPFLVLGGELGNSSGEPAYLKQFWPKLRELGLNTVIAPVYWDQLEPAPGRFDFTQVDGLLADARAQSVRDHGPPAGRLSQVQAFASCFARARVVGRPARRREVELVTGDRRP